MSYFDDTAFVGNSITQGLQLYGGPTNATYFASQGLSVIAATGQAFANIGGTNYTIANALSIGEYKKVYIMLGINEAGIDSESFYSYYKNLIDIVKSSTEGATIYLQTIVPVSAERSSRGDAINNDNVARLNGVIKKLAVDNSIYCIDVAWAITNGTYVLSSTESSDGVHLGRNSVATWVDYVRRHTEK